MNDEKIMIGAMQEFQKKLETANVKLTQDFQKILKEALRDAEQQDRQKEGDELTALEKEFESE